ncbi:hypothetical protein ACHAXS_011044 [Conticribra weissflogii]
MPGGIVIVPKKKKKKSPATSSSTTSAAVKPSSVPPPLVAVQKSLANDNASAANGIRHGAAAASTALAGIPGNAPSTTNGKYPSSRTSHAKSSTGTGRNAITIKPYERPPEIPPDFYDVNLKALKRAASCVLHKRPLVASDEGGGKARLVGREELYRSVENLCVHKFGPRLYADVVVMLDEAAGEVVRRLGRGRVTGVDMGEGAADHAAGGEGKEGDVDAVVDPNSCAVGYRTSLFISSLNLEEGGLSQQQQQQQQQHYLQIEGARKESRNMDAGLTSETNCNKHDIDSNHNNSSSGNESSVTPAEKRYDILRRMHSICKVSYAEEYLTFIRSIFLVLDRAYVFYSEEDLERIGGSIGEVTVNEVIPTGAMKCDNKSFGNGLTKSCCDGGPPRGKVIERSASLGSNPRVWGLWDVGIACLRRHMLRCPSSCNASVGNNQLDSKTIDEGRHRYIPVLLAMLKTTAYAMLSEFDEELSSSFTVGSSAAVMGDSRPLIRNCVRSCIDLAALSSLLEEVIIAAAVRFDREGVWWGNLINVEDVNSAGGNAGGRDITGTRRTAPKFLLHVENRLKQSSNLTSYYLPSNATAVSALRQLASGAAKASKSKSTSVSAVSPSLVWAAANSNNTRRILPSIIETQLLAPHLSPSGILHPRHLYPMFDDDDGGGTGGLAEWRTQSGQKAFVDAKRLYTLSWRLTASSPSSPYSKTSTQSHKTALDQLRIAFGEYGRLRGTEIIKRGSVAGTKAVNKDIEKKIIPDLLAFKSHLESLHTMAFRSDESFGAMLRSILEDVLNCSSSGELDGDGGRRIAELLAKYVDARFKDAKAQVTATQLVPATGVSGSAAAAAAVTDSNEAFQNEVMSLFRHVHSKDVFEAFFKRDLAKRLLTGRSVSSDVEKSFLSKLKAECGTGYTSKMEGMFKDMELSRDIMSSYSAYSSGAINAVMDNVKPIDVDVQVLTTGYWPVYPKYPNIILPPEILAQKSKFENYYNNKYQGRRITWQYSLGNCVVRALFPKQSVHKELIVNLCQSLVLLCFQYDDGQDGMGLTIDEVMAKTGIDDRNETERVLQSLSLGRDGTRVLCKVDYDFPIKSSSPVIFESPGAQATKKQKNRKNVGPHDRFFFNASFTSNQRRIRITNITMKETAEERTKTHEAVSKDRLYLIDAAVVRIMKARKTIDHRGLMGEVMAQLKFPASSTDVKKRVESLIEREYMERVEGDRSRYNYLA